MKAISIKLPDELDVRLRAFMRQRKMGRSDLVREALDAYLSHHHDGSMLSSFADLAQDLIGSVRGPEDLATNKKYLEGYGE